MSNTLLMLCIPFAGLLLCIAVMPLVKPEWWEKHQAHAVILWSLLFAIPFALFYGAPKAVETVLECLIGDYLTFIVLLFGLFCVAGNIKLEGSLVGNPKVNVIMLAVGTFFSSCIGTTGASMLFVRPIIQMNSWRKNKRHIMVFFIFLVSNIGGCLTPIGDPPLLMGFSRGVSFFWSMRLFPVYHLDKKAYQKDITKGLMPEVKENEPLIRIKGAHNFLYIVMIVIAVILSGVLPKLSAFQNAAGEVIGIPIFREVTLTVPAIIEIAIILLAALLSFKTTPKEVRVQNHFTWGAIQEVAVLFIGIFITMQPALMVLKSAGSGLGDVLGNRSTFKLPRQYTDISGFPYYSGSHALYYRCRNHTGSGAGQDAYGNFVWRCIYGSQHIYWKCTELYGQVIIRRKRYQHAIVLWLHMVVIALSDTCFHHRYDHILFIGGMNYGIL